jgi:ferric-dicitrate binding protein FerR (iron transport regulator)
MMTDETFSRYLDGQVALQPRPTDNVDGARAYREFMRRKRVARLRRVRRVLAYAAAVVLLVGSTWFVAAHTYQQSRPVEYNTIIVPPGHRSLLTLAEGTQVMLNARSTLRYPTSFDGEHRQVELTGEGYFKVTKDAAHPFVVNTPKVDVSVLGTTLNVKCDSAGTHSEVSLLEGALYATLRDGGQQITLSPMQTLQLNDGRGTLSTLTNTDKFLWTEGIIAFDHLTLDEIARKIEWCYDTRIVLRNPRAAAERYSGKFRQQDGPYEILRILQRTGHFRLSKDEVKNVFEIK